MIYKTLYLYDKGKGLEQKMVSIIVPAYNAEGSIAKCITSIIHQTYKNIEIIVVDDGSQDSTASIIDGLAKKHKNIKCFHQVNSGVSKARNIGLNNTQGEYVYFVDADDFLEKDTLMKLVKLSKITDVDLIASEIVDKYGTSKTRGIYIKKNNFVALNKKSIAENMFYIRMGSAVGKLYKKSIIANNQLKFQENISLAEDLIFVHKYVMCCSSIAKIGSSNYFVVNKPVSLSKMYLSNIELVIKEQVKIFEAIFETFPIYKDIYYQYEMNYIANGNIMYVKNMYLKGNPYTRKERLKNIRNLYKSGNCKIFHQLKSNDKPKLFTDKIYCLIFKTNSIYIIDLFFGIREQIRDLKTKLQYRRVVHE